MFRRKSSGTVVSKDHSFSKFSDAWEVLGKDGDLLQPIEQDTNAENYICIDNIVLCSDIPEGQQKENQIERAHSSGDLQINKQDLQLVPIDQVSQANLGQDTAKLKDIELRKLENPYDFKIKNDQNLTFQFTLADPYSSQKDTIKATNLYYQKAPLGCETLDSSQDNTFAQYLQAQKQKEYSYFMGASGSLNLDSNSDVYKQIAPEWQIGLFSQVRKLRLYVNKNQVKRHKLWFILFGGFVVVFGIQKCFNISHKPQPIKESNRIEYFTQKFQEKFNQLPILQAH